MAKFETELQMAERHVRDGERHVAGQRKILEDLQEHGHPTELAERLLVNLEDLLTMHRQHLAHVQEEQK